MTPAIQTFGNFSTREAAERKRRSLDRRIDVRFANPKKTNFRDARFPGSPRKRAIGADSARNGRLDSESTSESRRLIGKCTARRSKAPVENAVTIRDSRRERDRARASPFNRAMVAVSNRAVSTRTRVSTFRRALKAERVFSNRRARSRPRSRTRDGHNHHARAFPAAFL